MANCECLAAWVDTEPCICGEMPGAPAELNTKKLAEAKSLADEIGRMDRTLKRLRPGAGNSRVVVMGGQYDDNLELYMPDDMTVAIINTMRRQTLIKLAATGVISGSIGHRPVLK